MELTSLLFIFIVLGILYLYKIQFPKIHEKARNLYAKQLDELQIKLKYLEENRIDIKEVISIKEHDRVQQELEFKLALLQDHNDEITAKLARSEEKEKTLVSQRQSNHVKLGQITENFYPLLSEFPYDPKKCTSILSPIDVLYFGDNELVFIEIKSGNSQLSQKQRNIKRIVDEGKVRFEIHRINEKGVKIK